MGFIRKGKAHEFVRFMSKVAFGEKAEDCWNWKAGAHEEGYGNFKTEGVTYLAHRWMYAHVNGQISDGALIRHRCDNPRCVNPLHLEEGTHAQNTQDCIFRNRRAVFTGEKHPSAVLSEQSVLEIRRLASLGYTHHWIGEQFGVSKRHIGGIVRRDYWQHI